MNKFYKNNYPETNLYKKMSVKSEMLTQMIYGDKFSILKTASKWLKIKIINDGYIGFIKKKEIYILLTKYSQGFSSFCKYIQKFK